MARVFYDRNREAIYIDGAKQAYPARSLFVSQLGNKVTIKVHETGVPVLGPILWSRVLDGDNLPRTDMLDLLQYLMDTFNQDSHLTDQEVCDIVDPGDVVALYEANL